jgi:Leucine-rich repeat (LRR) protein
VPNSNSAVVRLTSTRRREPNDSNPNTTEIATRTTRRVVVRPQASRRPAAVVETMESRTHLSVSKDAAGFTVVTPSAGDKVIYVSASGNDGNSGSASAPIRSLSKGVGMLRSGTGDQLLLKRGDSFGGNLGFWSKSGANASRPLVVGTYGTGSRPVVNTGGTYALSIGTKAGVHDLTVQGIKFVSNGSAVADGLSVSGKATNLVFEDLEITKYVNNIVLQKFFGPITNVTVRRSVITDSFSRSGRNSEGLFAEAVDGLTLEENVFDHNGWGNGRGATVFNHGAYIRASSNNFVARGNIFSNSSSHGLQARAGGVIENNLFINNATGMSFGLVNGSPVKPGGVSGRVTNNVFMGTHNIGSGIRGVAIEAGNIKRGGTQISGNVIANGNTSSKLPAIQLAVGSNNDNAGSAVGINDLTVSNNVVYNYSQGFWVVGGQSPGSGQKALNNLTVSNNQLQKIATAQAIIKGSPYGNYSNNMYSTMVYNKYFTNSGGTKAQVNYVDASRTPGKMAGGSNDAFVSQARGLGKSNWKTNLTASAVVNWIKAGFTKTGAQALSAKAVVS